MPTLTALDLHFSRLIRRLCGGDADVALAAALASARTSERHMCADLRDFAGKAVTLEAPGETLEVRAPEIDEWLERLARSNVVAVRGDSAPLIIDGTRLYLQRYWRYERMLIDRISALAQSPAQDCDGARVREVLDRHFGPESPEAPDDQRRAASIALARKFCIITGGPGTGKTTTVAKILAALLEMQTGLRIALVAPTGKAAARLQEAVTAAVDRLQCPETVRAAIPRDASTIHRLLGAREGSPFFRHDKRNPLRCDAVVVDESSMVDLPLMAKLLDAVPEHARVVLLGDKDQLASVEAGAVLGHLCGGDGKRPTDDTDTTDGEGRERAYPRGGRSGERQPGFESRPIAGCVARLRRSYRFGADSGIGALAAAVNRGDAVAAMKVITGGAYPDLRWPRAEAGTSFAGYLSQCARDGYAGYLSAGSVEEAFDRFERFRVLCALRKGPFGVETVNAMVRRILDRNGFVDADTPWYHRRPVLIGENDYLSGLFNGDTGLLWRDAGGALRACFRESRATGPGSAVRSLTPQRLPAHETAFAVTVHKSQGSEFDRVIIVLPEEYSPVLTRELLYTAITRARSWVEIWGSEEILRRTIESRIERASGLRDALWG